MAQGKLDESTRAELLDVLADAVVVADPNGIVVYWNRGAEHLFGWSAAEVIGQTLDLIIPERQRAAHWEGYRRVMASGVTRYGDELLRVPSLHADGRRRSIAFTVTLLKEGDQVTGIAAVMRDETQRWADEQELRKRVREADSS